MCIAAYVLNRAATILQEELSPLYAYQCGRALERLGKFLDANQLSTIPCNWRSNIPHPGHHHIKIGEEFEKRRKKKLPTQEHLEAVAEAYIRSTEPVDVLVSSVMAVLLCQPGRLSEALTLPEMCVVVRDDNKPGVFLRWWPAKGAPPLLKPVPATMADIAVEAVGKIAKITDTARRVAKWYEDNPKKYIFTQN